MNIIGTSTILVLSKFKTKSADGTKEYPTVSLMVGNEAGTMSCSEEVFNAVDSGKTYMVESVYNEQYKSFKFSRVLQQVK